MRGKLRYAVLFLVGILVAMVIYPLLHEMGHGIVTVLLGNKVADFSIYPIPSMVSMGNINGTIEIVFTGLGGMFFPVAVTRIIRTDRFWIWYVNTLLKGINLMAFGISLCSIIYKESKLFEQDDFRTILSVWENGRDFCVVFLIMMIMILLIDISREHLLKKCIAYLMK